MNKSFFLSIVFLSMIITSCDKGDEINNDKIKITGTWNVSLIKRFDTDDILISEEALDTIRLSKLSINELVIQSMHIDTSRSFYFLMYSSYEYKNGILKQYPDSLLDIDMNTYYWNPADSMFGDFSVKSSPFESIIEQINKFFFIEKRELENIGSIIIEYNRLGGEYIDLKNEFETYSIVKEKSLEIKSFKEKINYSKSNRKTKMPVYNNILRINQIYKPKN